MFGTTEACHDSRPWRTRHPLLCGGREGQQGKGYGEGAGHQFISSY
jgi:hypothetical protein